MNDTEIRATAKTSVRGFGKIKVQQAEEATPGHTRVATPRIANQSVSLERIRSLQRNAPSNSIASTSVVKGESANVHVFKHDLP